MKKHASVYWSALISIATTVLCIGVPGNLALAQEAASSNSAPSTAPPANSSAQAPALPFGVEEVVKMYQGGISKDVLVSYIQNTVLPFHLTADGIIYLQHLGVPQEVTSALIHRDGELQRQAMAAYQQQQQWSQTMQQQQPAAVPAPNNQVAAANPAPPVVTPGTPPPVAPYAYPPAAPVAPAVAYPDYSVYPYYGYPYYYGPGVIIGGGWGWGWGHGGWGRGGFGHR